LRRLPKLNTKRAKTGRNRKAKRGSSRPNRMAQSLGPSLLGSSKTSSSNVNTAGSLGIFGQAANDNLKIDYNLPSMEQPQSVSNKSNPELSSIESQIGDLAKVAAKIATVTKGQQDGLIDQVKDAERETNQGQLEKSGSLLGGSVLGSVLGPISLMFKSLISKFKDLSEVVDEKVDQQRSLSGRAGFATGSGLMDLTGGKKGRFKATSKLSDLSKKEVRTLGKRGIIQSGNSFRNAATGKFVSKAAIADTLAKKPGLISRGVSGIANMAKSGAGKLAGTFGSTVSKIAPNASKVVGAAAIKKLAGPIIGKALGKTALKSIPIIGAVAGLGFAVGRLLEGDVVGAGLDAASGLAGPFTAIPALIASVARDVYTGAYGVPPEQDPQAGERMSAVTSAVKDLVSEQLKDKVESQDTASGKKYDPKLPEIKPVKAAVTKNQQAPPSIPQVQKLAAPTAAMEKPANDNSASSGGGSNTPPPAVEASNKSDPMPSTTTSSFSESPPKADAQPTISSSPPTISATPTREPGAGTTGTDIQKASMENESLANGPVPNIQTGKGAMPTPSRDLTSRSGATGIGNVPDPNYGNMGKIANQLYFRASA